MKKRKVLLIGPPVRRLYKHLIVLFALILTPLATPAAEPPTKPPTVIQMPVITCPADVIIISLKAEVSALQKAVKHLDDEKFYSNWRTYDLDAQRVLRISDLTDKQKRGFFLHQGEVLHNRLKTTAKDFQAAIEKMTDPDATKSINVPNEAKEQIVKDYIKASKKIKELLSALQKTHRDLAAKRELLVEKFIEDYKDKDKQLVGELKQYLEKIEKTHRHSGLIKPDEGK